METVKGPQTYDAQGEYLKDQNQRRTPGNIPVEVMRRAQKAVLGAVQNDLVVKASMHPGFSAKIEKWNMLTKEQKYLAGADLKDEDEMKAAIIVENDMDVVRFLTDRIDEFRAANEAKQ
jgi:hypothetical protein